MNISAELMTFKVRLKSTHLNSLKTPVTPVRVIHQKQEQNSHHQSQLWAFLNWSEWGACTSTLYTCIYNTLRFVHNTGVSLDQGPLAVLSLYFVPLSVEIKWAVCQYWTKTYLQLSQMLTSWFYTISLLIVELLAIHVDICISWCVCVQ